MGTQVGSSRLRSPANARLAPRPGLSLMPRHEHKSPMATVHSRAKHDLCLNPDESEPLIGFLDRRRNQLSAFFYFSIPSFSGSGPDCARLIY